MREIGKKSRIFFPTRTVPEISFLTLINLRALFNLKNIKYLIFPTKKKIIKRKSNLKKYKKKTRSLSSLMNRKIISVRDPMKMRT